MSLTRIAIAALLASTAVETPAVAEAPAAVETPAAVEAAPPAPVPGPLRPLVQTAPTEAAKPAGRTSPARRDPAPPMAVRSWKGTLGPLAAGELARGRVVLDVQTHQVRIDDFAVTDAPGLEVALVAGDDVKTTAAVLAAKRVSLGRLRKIKATVILRFPAELDPAVYRTLVVWSRRDRAPRAVARLAPNRTG